MRQIVLDTETTGLEAKQGHRIIEIGCLVLQNRRLVEDPRFHFHYYLNPQRPVDEGALAVHGLSDEFLADKPLFEDVVDELLAFVEGAEVIIHNAAFDVEFLDAELARLGRRAFGQHCASVTDSLKMARQLHPGKRNSLDALCERYQINNAQRTLHGALLDAGLLADVYLAMTRGQDSLEMSFAAQAEAETAPPLDTSGLKVLAASSQECAAHEALLEGLQKAGKNGALWLREGA